MRVRGVVYLCTLCILLLPAWSAWGQPFYTVTDLGSMIPLAINEDGVIVGSATIAGVQTPVSWVAGHQTPLATLGAGGRADAITRTMEAVGYVLTTPIATQQASQWDAQGRVTLLPGVTSDLASAATAKNEAGWIAGYGDIPNQGGPLIRAKRWSPLGVVENLAPVGGSDSFAGAIDASNRLWGSTETATETHAALWDAQGTLHDLGTLGGLFATIFDVNHSGIGVGLSTTASGASVAVYATAAGGVQPLPMLQGMVELCGHILARWIGCNAYAINDLPQAVGSCWTSAPNPSLTVEHAVSWQNDGSVTDLNAWIDPRAGWVLGHAQDMNNVGQIVGQGWLNGLVRGFLLTPADETTALAAYEVVKDVRETLPAHVRERLPAGLFHR
jgi:uncharacterized membrane protein